MVGQESVDEVAVTFEGGQLSHPAQMCRPRWVSDKIALGGTAPT